jgi:HK97 family phage prohead protease
MICDQLARPFQLKALGDDGSFAGYGSVFGVADAFADVVAPGAFTRSLAEHASLGTLPAMLWQHDSRQPIGVWSALREDAVGLQVAGRLALKTPGGAAAYELLKLGAVNGLSIGYVTITSKIDETTRRRHLLEVDLWEVSLVTFPANPRARVTAVKAPPCIAAGRDGGAPLADLVRLVRQRTEHLTAITKGTR